jgi:hypothetical protein
LHAPPAEHDENKIENRFLKKTGESISFEEFIQKYLKHLFKRTCDYYQKEGKNIYEKLSHYGHPPERRGRLWFKMHMNTLISQYFI